MDKAPALAQALDVLRDVTRLAPYYRHARHHEDHPHGLEDEGQGGECLFHAAVGAQVVARAPPHDEDGTGAQPHAVGCIAVTAARRATVEVLYFCIERHAEAVAVAVEFVRLYEVITKGEAEALEPQFVLVVHLVVHVLAEQHQGSTATLRGVTGTDGVVEIRERAVAVYLERPLLAAVGEDEVARHGVDLLSDGLVAVFEDVGAHAVVVAFLHLVEQALYGVWLQLQVIVEHEDALALYLGVGQHALRHHAFLHPHILFAPHGERRALVAFGYIHDDALGLHRLAGYRLQFAAEVVAAQSERADGNGICKHKCLYKVYISVCIIDILDYRKQERLIVKQYASSVDLIFLYFYGVSSFSLAPRSFFHNLSRDCRP